MNFRRFLLAITLFVALPLPAMSGAEEAPSANTATAVESHGDSHKKHHGLPKLSLIHI